MQNMDFWFFWNIFKKRWNIILLIACVSAMGVGVYSKLFIKPIYTSSVSLYLGRVTENSLEGAARALGNSAVGAPFVGIYGACSTCTEGIMLLSELIAGGADIGASVTGSHNSVAERQFRGPLEYGSQRSPSAQWTATAAGAVILCSPDCKRASSSPVRITEYMAGRPINSGSLDQSNMGGAMAFSAFDTLVRYFSSSDTRYTDLDLIVTGDLGRVGSDVLRYLLEPRYPGISSRLCDCGLMLYDRKRRDVHAGASGCGCSASVLASYLYPKLLDGNLRDILFLSTGAIMSVSSVQQGCPIIGITPLIRIRRY